MAAGTSRKISAASARAHTRRSGHSRTSKSSSICGIFSKVFVVVVAGAFAWGLVAIQPPPPKLCGSPSGPAVTAPRIKLRDGRNLAYKEHGVPKHDSKYKFVYVHGFNDNRNSVTSFFPDEVTKELGIYVVSFDRPGYGESDPHPNRTLESFAYDIEELADKLELGRKLYIYGVSIGGQLTWSALKYIPHRLAGASLMAPAVNYWWKGLPDEVSSEAFKRTPLNDQWALRVAHYAPWLTYWWNTQSFFPICNAISGDPVIFSRRDNEMIANVGKAAIEKIKLETRKQGEYESLHRDLMFSFGVWGFDPMDMKNPFSEGDGKVHVWQGDEDALVFPEIQRYIAGKLPWIHYHELPGVGHFLGNDVQMSSTILSAVVSA